MTIESNSIFGIAALGGAGLEREWSGHATGPEAHFTGKSGDRHIAGRLRVRRVSDRIASERGLPEAIVLDNGREPAEFAAKQRR